MIAQRLARCDSAAPFGLRYGEIALALKIPIGTVKMYISRAKRRLRDELEAPLAIAA